MVFRLYTLAAVLLVSIASAEVVMDPLKALEVDPGKTPPPPTEGLMVVEDVMMEAKDPETTGEPEIAKDPETTAEVEVVVETKEPETTAEAVAETKEVVIIDEENTSKEPETAQQVPTKLLIVQEDKATEVPPVETDAAATSLPVSTLPETELEDGSECKTKSDLCPVARCMEPPAGCMINPNPALVFDKVNNVCCPIRLCDFINVETQMACSATMGDPAKPEMETTAEVTTAVEDSTPYIDTTEEPKTEIEESFECNVVNAKFWSAAETTWCCNSNPKLCPEVLFGVADAVVTTDVDTTNIVTTEKITTADVETEVVTSAATDLPSEEVSAEVVIPDNGVQFGATGDAATEASDTSNTAAIVAIVMVLIVVLIGAGYYYTKKQSRNRDIMRNAVMLSPGADLFRSGDEDVIYENEAKA